MSMTGVLRGGEKVMLIKLYLQEAVQRAFLVAVVYIVLKGIYLAIMKKEVHIGKEILYCVTYDLYGYFIGLYYVAKHAYGNRIQWEILFYL